MNARTRQFPLFVNLLLCASNACRSKPLQHCVSRDLNTNIHPSARLYVYVPLHLLTPSCTCADILVSFLRCSLDFHHTRRRRDSGALDVMVVQHEDEVMACTPFHVRFSKVKRINPMFAMTDVRIDVWRSLYCTLPYCALTIYKQPVTP